MTCQSDFGAALPLKQFAVDVEESLSPVANSKQCLNGLVNSPTADDKNGSPRSMDIYCGGRPMSQIKRRKLSSATSEDNQLDVLSAVKELLRELVHKCAVVCRVSSSKINIQRSQRRSIRQKPACLICGARAEESSEFGCDRTHSDQPTRVYTCLYCGRIHPSEQAVIEHISINHRSCDAALPLNRKPFLSIEIGPLVLSHDMSDSGKRSQLLEMASQSLISTMRCPICKMVFFPNRRNLAMHLIKYHRSSQLMIFRREDTSPPYLTISFERMLGFLILTAKAEQLTCTVEKETITIGDLIKSARRLTVPTFEQRLMYRCIPCKREFEMEEEMIRHCFCIHLRHVWDDFNWIKVSEQNNSSLSREYFCPRCSFSHSSLLLMNKHSLVRHAIQNEEAVFECNVCKSEIPADCLEAHFTRSCCDDPQFWIASSRKQTSELSIQCSVGPVKLQLTPATVLSFKRKRGCVRNFRMRVVSRRAAPEGREFRLAVFPPVPPLESLPLWPSKQDLFDALCAKRISSCPSEQPSAPTVFACSICRFRAYSKEELTTHARIHTGQKTEGQLVCFRCPHRFDEVAELFEHEICHTSYSPYRCTGCRCVFFDRRFAVDHLSSCTGSSTAIASVQEPSVRALWKRCRPFNINLELNCYDLRELNSVKFELDNVSAPNADPQTLMNTALSAIADKCGGLLLLQDKQPPVEEEIPEKRRLWPMHRRRRRRRRLRYCPVQGRKRRTPSVHSLPAKRQAKQCEICGFRYEGSRRLEYAHARQHQLENSNSRLFAQRRYHCGRCPYASENSVDLRRHEYRHLKAGPFFCKLCRKDFCQQADCINHVVHDHHETEALEDKVEFYVPPEEMIGLTTFHLRVKTRKRRRMTDIPVISDVESAEMHGVVRVKREKFAADDVCQDSFEGKRPCLTPRTTAFHIGEYNALQASRAGPVCETFHEVAYRRPEWFACIRCRLTSADKTRDAHDRLVLHSMHCHSSFRPYSCAHCKYRAVSREAVRIHSILEHGSEECSQDVADEDIQLVSVTIGRRFLCEKLAVKPIPQSGPDVLAGCMMECGPLSYKCLRCCICFFQAERLAEHLQLARHVIFCRQCDQQGRRFSAFVRHYNRHHQADWLVGDAGRHRCLVCYMDLADNARLMDHLVRVHYLCPEAAYTGQLCQLVHILLTSNAAFVYRDMSQMKLQPDMLRRAGRLSSELANRKPEERLQQLEQILSCCPVCLSVRSPCAASPVCVCEEFNLKCPSPDGQLRLTAYGLRTLRFNLVSIVESCRNNAHISCAPSAVSLPLDMSRSE